MWQGEAELRAFFQSSLEPHETLGPVAYGLWREKPVALLGRLLTAGLGAWVGGATEPDAGVGVGAASSRLLLVPMRRVQRVLRMRVEIVFETLVTIPSSEFRSHGVEARRGKHGYVELDARLTARRIELWFPPAKGFPDNVRRAGEIMDHVGECRVTGRA